MKLVPFLTWRYAVAVMALALAASGPCVLADPAPAGSPAAGEPKPALSFDALSAEIDAALKEMDGLIAVQKPPVTAKQADAAAARATFKAVSDAMVAAPTNSIERAQKARTALDIAAQIAWFEFEAGRYDGAGEWFARRADLKKQSYDNWRGYLEERLVTRGRRVREMRALKPPAELAMPVQIFIDCLNNIRVAAAMMLQARAYESNDSTTLLRYAELELALRMEERDDLKRSGAEEGKLQHKQTQIASAFESMGAAYQAMARFENARSAYDQSLTLRRALPVTLASRSTDSPLRSLGMMYARMGDFPKALEYTTQALAEVEAATPQVEKAIAEQEDADLKAMLRVQHLQSRIVLLNNLGSFTINLCDYARAAGYLQRAEREVAALPEEGIGGWVKGYMGASVVGNNVVLLADSGDTEGALRKSGEVIALWRAQGNDDGAAQALVNRAGLLYEKGDSAGAQQDVAQARGLFAADGDLRAVLSTVEFQALIERESNKLDDAARHAGEALELARKLGDLSWTASSGRALALINLAQGKVAAAAALLPEIEAADARAGVPLGTAGTHYVRGQVLEAKGDAPGALKQYESAITLAEGVRATAASGAAFGDLKSIYRYYEQIVGLLIKQGRADEAFNYLTRARSKRLQQSLRLSSLKSGDKAMQTLLDLAGALDKKLGTVRAQLQEEQARPTVERDATKVDNLKVLAASTQAEFFKVVQQIKEKNPGYEKVLSIKPGDLKKAQRALPPDAVLVQYVPVGEQLYIFAVTRDALKVYTPPVSPDSVWQRVRGFRQKIEAAQAKAVAGQKIAIADWKSEDADTKALREDLTQLYAMLIAPLEADLKDKATIGFIPTGLLFYMPLHALAHETPQGLRFLVEEKQVAYLAGSDVLAVVQAHDEAQFGKGLLAFGNPTGADLPSALAEVKSIAQIYPGSRVLTGAEAKKAALEEPAGLDRRVLHFATHGVLNSMRPDQSYIQLAPGAAADDYKLSVGEVYGLNLNRVDLVTLSACSTAIGERNPDGAEITSLAESFSSAGAPTVVASLWSVSDEATRATMVKFYTALAAGKSKGAALREAQAALLRDPVLGHPFYWAPFMLLGDWR